MRFNRLAYLALRSSLGWSQNQAAKRAGITQSGLSLIETGKREPTPETMRKLAAGLGVPLGAIVTFPDEPAAAEAVA